MGHRTRAQVKAQLPLSAKVEVSVPQRTVTATVDMPTNQLTLVDASVQPISFYRLPETVSDVDRLADEVVVFSEEINRVKTVGINLLFLVL